MLAPSRRAPPRPPHRAPAPTRTAALAAPATPPPCRPCRAQQERVSGEWYEDVIDALARRALARARGGPAGAANTSGSSSSHGGSGANAKKYIVGIAGGPGSGKSTLATAVAGRINELVAAATAGAGAGEGDAAAAPPHAVVLPMDGFHLYKAQLDAMPDPQAAYARRGAPWTFDGAAFVAAVRLVATQGSAALPSFDHGVGDPVEGDIWIAPETAVVLVEGNYVLLDEEPWRGLRAEGLLDEAWFVECPLEEAMGRVFARQTGLGLAPEVSRGRIAANDAPNALLVAASARHADVVVPSTVPFRGR